MIKWFGAPRNRCQKLSWQGGPEGYALSHWLSVQSFPLLPDPGVGSGFLLPKYWPPTHRRTGAQTTTQAGKNLARENLNLMLCLNLLKLTEVFPRQPERRALHMRHDLIERPSGEDELDPDPEP